MSEIVQTAAEQYELIPFERRLSSESRFLALTIEDVASMMPALERYRDAQLAVLQPPTGDVDETRTLVLPLEFSQSLTVPHLLRGMVMQMLIAPQSRVVFAPNNALGVNTVNFKNLDKMDRSLMKAGNYQPIGDVFAASLERLDAKQNLGDLLIHGSSQGASTAFSIAAAGIVRNKILAVSGVEMPSATNRSSVGLARDFLLSGGDLAKAVKESEVTAQRQAMRGMNLVKDIAKFGVYAPSTRMNRLLVRAMAGSANSMVHDVVDRLDGDAVITLQGYEGSRVWDSDSLVPAVKRAVTLIHLTGSEDTKHATPNNLRYNAANAYVGLGLPSVA